MVKATYGVQNERGEGGSEGGAHCEFVGVLGEGSGGPERRHRLRLGGGQLKKTAMASATQLLGSRWSPERMKPSAEILQDVFPSDGDDGGRGKRTRQW